MSASCGGVAIQYSPTTDDQDGGTVLVVAVVSCQLWFFKKRIIVACQTIQLVSRITTNCDYSLHCGIKILLSLRLGDNYGMNRITFS